jgi:hypothetical protein
MTDSSKNIICKIENGQQCCENFGVYTENELNDFIGANVIKIKKDNLMLGSA